MISNALLGRLAPVTLSALRAVAGLIFLAHGTAKLIGWPATGRSVEMLSLPWFAGVIELATGALLAVGFQSRAAAFLASGTMAFAYWIAHAPNSPFPVVNHGDAAILYCFVFLHVVFAGPGPLSLDALLGRDGRAGAPAKATAAATESEAEAA